MASTRHLAAILAADVAGYSRLMGVDEEGTHERLKAHFRQLIDPKIKEHQGRVVKNTGDGLLAEFASVVDAVRCSAEVQRGMLDREPEVADERRIRFRIGINLGDVIAEDGDIFGDGVNVAARLEALAEPGGICVSGTVRDQVRDKLPYALDDMGEQSVKNIARPVRVYALRPEAVADLPARSVQFAASRRRPTTPVAMAAAAAALLVIAGIGWWLWPTPRSLPTATVPGAPAAVSVVQPLVAPRLSIVVLPFTNLNNDPEQQYFADAFTEDLTTDLSQIPSMFVISRNTAFTYKDKPINAKQIGHDLGVRFVLEGSVRRSDNKIRVNAQLIDAETDAHLWSERFDRNTSDLGALQNEITARIANGLNLEMVSVEAARSTNNPGALDYILRARAASAKPNSREKHAEVISLFERALALDPQSLEAQIRLATVLVDRTLDEMTESPTADLSRAERLIEEALAASPRNPLAYYAKGQFLRRQRGCEEAIPQYEKALAFNPNWAMALSHIGRCKTYIGPIEEAIPAQEQAIRLSPRDPAIALWYYRIGEAHLLQSHIDDAVLWLEKAKRAVPAWQVVRGYLASAYALKGDSERAAAELAEARRLAGEGYLQSIAQSRARTRYETPAIRALAEATYYEGLRKAGVPEE